MSKQYDNTNSGVLFKNDMEGKSENFPPYGGSINVEGREYFVSAWVKEGNKGKFFSLAVKPKDAAQQKSRRDEPPANDFDSDSIPF